MSFTIDVKSAMTFVVTIPALSIVVFGIMLVSIPLFKKVQARLDKVMLLTRENLEGARVIRAFNRQQKEVDEFDKSTDDLMDIQLYVGRISAFLNPVTYAIINLATVAIIWIAAGQTDIGILSQGKVVALINYMSQILVELVKLANLIISITKSVACGNRIQAVLDIEPSMEDGSASSGDKNSEYAVEMEGVSFKYASASADSIEDINLKIKKGETLGVIGSTGCGKTTLISLIPRFYDCTAGKVKVNGVDVKDYSQKALRDKVAVVMQKTVLFNGSIRDNIRWGNENATDDEISQAVSSAQAADVVASKPEGLDFIVEQGGKNLSGGQQQRLSIARALVRRPEILILDNSSSALDYATEAALRKSISELDFKPTVITVSQRVSAVMHSDRIMVLEDGRAVGLGTHAQLLDSCSEYKELYESQVKSSKGGESA